MRCLIRIIPAVLASVVLLAGCSTDQLMPRVAWNGADEEFVVAYLDNDAPGPDKHFELRAIRYDKTGAGIGGVIYPFGKGAHQAVARPAIAWNPKKKHYLAAVAERTSNRDRVLLRPIAADGSSKCCPTPLFDDGFAQVHNGLSSQIGGHGTLQLTYNSLRDQFLVTFQRAVQKPGGVWNGVWGQLTDGEGTPLGSPVALYETQGFIQSHSVAHAPLTGTNPAGGRYVLVNGAHAALFDADLKPFLVSMNDPKYRPGEKTSNIVFLNHGVPKGEYAHSDVAYGEVSGNKRFLVVFGDGNNCRPNKPECTLGSLDKWVGVWGAYIDPTRTEYPLNDQEGEADNTPFPISKIDWSSGLRFSYRPKVAYDAVDKRFVVAWREMSSTANKPPETAASHIRAVYVDYDVADKLDGSSVPLPHDNLHPISKVTLPCQPNLTPKVCLSLEDPDFPDIAPGPKGAAIIVWQQTDPADSDDSDVERAVTKMP